MSAVKPTGALASPSSYLKPNSARLSRSVSALSSGRRSRAHTIHGSGLAPASFLTSSSIPPSTKGVPRLHTLSRAFTAHGGPRPSHSYLQTLQDYYDVAESAHRTAAAATIQDSTTGFPTSSNGDSLPPPSSSVTQYFTSQLADLWTPAVPTDDTHGHSAITTPSTSIDKSAPNWLSNFSAFEGLNSNTMGLSLNSTLLVQQMLFEEPLDSETPEAGKQSTAKSSTWVPATNRQRHN
ncbi:hypothetical protein H4R33_003777 [Dimargaris cristalligena]|nr:hypothetical protein H4R33_003777 [Dimargaris cristalligena]